MRGQNQTRLGRLRARSESNTPMGQRPGELAFVLVLLSLLVLLVLLALLW